MPSWDGPTRLEEGGLSFIKLFKYANAALCLNGHVAIASGMDVSHVLHGHECKDRQDKSTILFNEEFSYSNTEQLS